MPAGDLAGASLKNSDETYRGSVLVVLSRASLACRIKLPVCICGDTYEMYLVRVYSYIRALAVSLCCV